MALLALRLIDVAIFGSLGGLWIGGAIFIVLLYRWLLSFEGGDGPTERPLAVPVQTRPAAEPAPREHVPGRMALPQGASAREALSHS